MKWVIFNTDVQGYKKNSLGLVESIETPVVGLIAEGLDKEVGYFIDTSLKEKHLSALTEFEVSEDVLPAYLHLIQKKYLKISLSELLDVIPGSVGEFNEVYWKKKLENYTKANNLGLL